MYDYNVCIKFVLLLEYLRYKYKKDSIKTYDFVKAEILCLRDEPRLS